MTGALVILAVTALIGLILFLTDKKYYRHHHQGTGKEPIQKDNSEESSETQEPEVCCGMHLVCEKTSLSPVSDEIIYYDDEELDRFIGRDSESYTSEEIEEFREILLTLLPQDIAGWARSITQRRIELPEDIRDELLMIIREQREQENIQSA